MEDEIWQYVQIIGLSLHQVNLNAEKISKELAKIMEKTEDEKEEED